MKNCVRVFRQVQYFIESGIRYHIRCHFIESSDIPVRSALAHARKILRCGLEPEAEQEDETKLGETHGATAEVIFTLSRLGTVAIIHLIQITGILIKS